MVVRKRLKIKGKALVFVTITVRKWIPIFDDKAIAEVMLNQFKESLDFYNVSLVGYVLMPSHLHALLGFDKVELLSKFVQSFKILGAKRVKNLLKMDLINFTNSSGGFSFWKPRFDDSIIFSEEQFKIKLDYIHNNPVKAGLINRSDEWLYSSASDWISDMPGLLRIDKEFRWT
ncbi:MAG: hypothetical protein GY865_03935 [candidate division Zixibacteria bacterium]|nr:hypothetical protein [candidate division Zixibacteria bacterium]